jgi:hypothetical protein
LMWPRSRRPAWTTRPPGNKTIQLGGPEALSPLETVRIFEQETHRKFAVEHVCREHLTAQKAAATDSLSASFAGLMLSLAQGDTIDTTVHCAWVANDCEWRNPRVQPTPAFWCSPPVPGPIGKDSKGRINPFAVPSGNGRYLREGDGWSRRILFSNGSRRKLLPDVDAFGCLRSLRARSALDGVSWVQGG